VVSAEKQLTMPPQKKSKKNTPTETDQEDHYNERDNEISFTTEPSETTDQERRAKLEALQKARAEKIAHTLEPFVEEDADEDDDQAVDRELERVQQQVQQLQKDKERFEIQLEAKRKVSKKLEKLNQAKEQIERMQREIEEMKEQENSALWQDSPHQNSGQNKRTPKENFFMGNGMSQFGIQIHPSQLGCKLHHGRQSSSHSLSQSTTTSKTPDSSL
jgi:ABC-type Fe3+-citrate transport system substrate-binding protein